MVDDLVQVFRSREALVTGSPDRPTLFGRVHPAATTVVGVAHVVPGGPGGDGSSLDGAIGAGTPGFWERHDDGDEVLLVLAGRATFTARAGERSQVVDVAAGDVLRVGAGVGHTATIHEALDVVFLLPEAGNETWTEPPPT